MSEILNNLNRLSPVNQEIIGSLAAELASRQEQQNVIRQQAMQMADMIAGSPLAAQQSNMPAYPEKQPTAYETTPEAFYVAESHEQIDLSQLSPADRAEYMRNYKPEASGTIDVDVPQPKYAYPPGFSSLPTASVKAEKESRFKRPSRKQLAYAGGAALVLSLTGGVATNGFGTGVTIMELSQSQNEADSNISGAEAIVDPAPAEVSPAPEAELKLNPADIAVGDCLDDNGQGKVLASATTSVGANQNYKLKKLNGEEVLLTNGDKKPRVELPEATINVAACIPSEARKDAIAVDGNKVIINWDKIDRQLGVVPGGMPPTVEEWDMDAEPGVTDRATVAALVAAMRDPANHAAAINITRAEYGKKIIAENEPALQSGLTKALKNEVTAQIASLQEAKKVPDGEVIVEFIETPKPFAYRGPAQEPTTVFEVVDVAVNDNDNNPETPVPPLEFK